MALPKLNNKEVGNQYSNNAALFNDRQISFSLSKSIYKYFKEIFTIH